MSLNSTRLLDSLDHAGEAIWWLDEAGRICAVNETACRALGYPREELLVLDVAAIDVNASPEGWARFWQDLLRGRDVTFESQYRTKEGRLFPVEVLSSRVEHEGRTYCCAFARDITERKRADEMLSYLASIVESSDDAIIGQTLEGIIVSWNAGAERIYGYAAEEVLGGPMSILIPSDRPDEVSRILERVCTEGAIDRYETTHLRKNGGPSGRPDRIDLSLTVSPIRDASGRIVGASTIARDITERKRAEAEKRSLEVQLLQAQKLEAIGTLAGGVAHDFNNILMAIMGFADMALDRLEPESPVRPVLREVQKAGARAATLVKQILTFSRKTTEERRPVEIQLILKESLKLLRASLPATIAIRHLIDPNCGAVLADPTQLHQVIMNLCTNAYHAMREKGGVLTVKLNRVEGAVMAEPRSAAAVPTASESGYVHLCVADTGHGMDRSTMERIFDPFFTTKPVGEGTGLGLSVTHGIVMSCGGHLTVESEPGAGSTFHVYLPEVSTGADAGHEIEEPEQIPLGRGHALYVDDEESLVRIGCAMLGRYGYKVSGYTNSIEALDAFRADPKGFDVVVTDHTMPHMTGVELAAQVTQLRPDVPIILVTGFSELDAPETTAHQGSGGLHVVLKPITPRALALTLYHVMHPEDAEEK